MRSVLPIAAVPLEIVIEASGILQRCASSTSAPAADGVSVLAASPRSRWATKVTVGCAGLPEIRLKSAFCSTSPIAAIMSTPPTAAAIAARPPPGLPLAVDLGADTGAGGGLFAAGVCAESDIAPAPFLTG